MTCNLIQEVDKGFIIRIPKSKTDKFRNGKNVFLAKNSGPHSASTLLVRYMALAKLQLQDNHFLFCPIKRNVSSGQVRLCNTILSYATFNKIIKSAI